MSFGFIPTKSAGELESIDLDSDRSERAPMARCVHCDYRWLFRPPNSGGGHLRGWCQQCNGYVCGRKVCREQGCVTVEQRLRNCEAGLGWWSSFTPIIVSVPTAPPKG